MMRGYARRAAFSLPALLVLACGSSDEGAAAVGSLVSDALALQEILGTDRSRAVLREVDEAVAAERPVLAATLIEEAAIPEVRRQAERLASAPVATHEGRRLRARAVRIHRSLVRGLELYRDALARGSGVEDMTLLEALEARREAEVDLIRLHDELAQIRPLAPDAIERARAGREVLLGGLPPHRREGTAENEPRDEDPPPVGGLDPALGEPQEPLPE